MVAPAISLQGVLWGFVQYHLALGRSSAWLLACNTSVSRQPDDPVTRMKDTPTKGDS